MENTLSDNLAELYRNRIAYEPSNRLLEDTRIVWHEGVILGKALQYRAFSVTSQ